MKRKGVQRGSRPAWLVMAALALPFVIGAGVSAVHQVSGRPAAQAPAAADAPAAVVSVGSDAAARSGLGG